MVDTPEEVVKRFEEQAWVQQKQHEILRVQQESINDLWEMITQLLTNRRQKSKGPKPNASFNKRKRKQKQEEISSSEKTESENNPNSEPLKPSSEEEDGSNNEARYSKQMNELEKHLKVIASRSNL